MGQRKDVNVRAWYRRSFAETGALGNERQYYNWLTERFPQSDYLVYPNIALQAIFNSEIKEDLKSGWASHEVLDEKTSLIPLPLTYASSIERLINLSLLLR